MTTAEDWERCRPFIVAALPCTGGTHEIEDIEAGIATGAFQFWAGERAAIITEIQSTPRKKIINFFLGGGRLSELLRMRPAIEAWGKSLGCDLATGSGRPSWARPLRDGGYQAMLTFFVKDLA